MPGKTAKSLLYTYFDSPVGSLLLAGEEGALWSITFPEDSKPHAPDPRWRRRDQAFAAVIDQLEAYFRGDLRDFSVPLALKGTDFQIQVWNELRNIPYGETVSYADLARRIGRPTAFRAVGLANGANPIPIIVPCHRVIGSNGKLTGYGGGLPIKQALLEIERRDLFAGQRTSPAA